MQFLGAVEKQLIWSTIEDIAGSRRIDETMTELLDGEPGGMAMMVASSRSDARVCSTAQSAITMLRAK
jgi:hypothetical protein